MRKLFLLLTALFTLAGAHAQVTYYVDSSRAASGAGTSWGTAFKELTGAIAAANAQTGAVQILVAKGTYKPTATTNRDTAFALLRSNLKIYGGYQPGGATRNSTLYPTVLSGEIGAPNNSADNSYHVVVIAGAGAGWDSLVLDGLTISDGCADNYLSKTYSDIFIPSWYGGGVFVRSVSGGKLAIRNCQLERNKAKKGGGVYTDYTSMSITNCAISNNESDDGSGSGLYIEFRSSAVLTNCAIVNNICEGSGSLFAERDCYLKLAGCLVANNVGHWDGAGIELDYGSTADIINCTIVSNLRNHLFLSTNGLVNPYGCVMNVVNSIIWENGVDNDGTFNISHSIVQGGWPGASSANPQFEDIANIAGPDGIIKTADDGLRLRKTSPAIDAGNKANVPPNLTKDIIGLQRIYGGQVDIGAYEFFEDRSVLYVDKNAPAPGNGFSWAAPFKELRDALAYASVSPDVNSILVAQGIYKPTNDARRDSSFVIFRGGLKIYGGYPSGGGTRNAAANPTVLSGDIGVANDSTDNSYHVMVVAGLNAASDSLVLDGLTFTKGNAYANGSKFYNGVELNRNTGAGMAVIANDSTARRIALTNCNFINNTASEGAGLFVKFSPVTITGCVFSGNNGGGGCGMRITNSSPTLKRCAFSENTGLVGVGLYVTYSSPRFFDCNMKNNAGDMNSSLGGGIYSLVSTSYFSNCMFEGNRAFTGGVIYNQGDSAFFSNCLFKLNVAQMGGAIFNDAKLSLMNCSFVADSASRGGGIYNNGTANINNGLFWKNKAQFQAGAIFNRGFYSVANSTLVANSSGAMGGGLYNDNAEATLNNSIVWNNTATGLGPNLYGNFSAAYSIIQGGYTGTGNLNADPLFVNASDPDGADNIFGTADDGLRLQLGSSAINTANSSALSSGTSTDITGAARIQQGGLDRGAYESPYTGATKFFVDNSVTESGDGGSWATALKELRDAMAVASVSPDVDSILVAKGAYKPTADVGRDSSFVINRGGLKLYGGYPAGGGTRNPLGNATILSGDIGTAGTATDNSYHVLVLSGIPATQDSVVVDGFTITQGYANGTGSKNINGQNIARDGGAGAAVVLVNNKTAFRNCIFAADTCTTGSGGGVLTSASSPTFTHCLFFRNKAVFGGGVFAFQGAPQLLHCTMAANNVTDFGAGFYSNGASATITNSLFWGNTSFSGSTLQAANGAASVNYSLVQGGYPGTGNLNMDPVFVNANDPDGGDGIFGTTDDGLRLKQCSPAINSASPAALPATVTTDISGFNRSFNTLPDMGAYEYRAIGEGNSLGINGDDSTYVIRTGVMPLLEQGCRIVGRITANGTNPMSGTLASKLWVDATLPTYNGQPFTKRHFQLTPSGGTTALVTLYATQQEFDDFNTASAVDLPASPSDAAGIARLRVYKFGGQSSNSTGLPATYGTAPLEINPDDAQVVWNAGQQRWQISFPVNGFSGFFIGASNTSPLPLMLLNFTARAANERVVLNWQTASELNTKEFVVERSSDGSSNWQAIGVVRAAGAGNGDYGFDDMAPALGRNYYRLQMKDKDERFSYSPVRVVDMGNVTNRIVSISPNPASAFLNLSFYTELKKPVVTIYDATGRMVRWYKLADNVRTHRVGTEDLKPGSYVISIQSGTVKLYEKLLIAK